MATLSGKTTSGAPAWDKYVKNNPQWNELELAIENKMDSPMLDTQGKKIVAQLKAGDKFTLRAKTTKTMSGKVYAQVRYNSKSGLIPINKIRKPTTTDVLAEEAIALDNLHAKICSIVKKVGPFELVIKGDPKRKVYKNINGTRNVTEKFLGREAKSDFNVTSTSGDAIYISHKKAGGANAFQQYGGISKQAGEKIQTHPEVESFLRAVAQNITQDKLNTAMYSYVKDDLLINLSVFGSEYGARSFGIDNVTIIGQGEAILKALPKYDNRFELDFSDHLVHNGDAAEFKRGDYTAVLGATFRAGRGFEVDGFKYKGARIGIYPKKLIVNRTGAEEV